MQNTNLEKFGKLAWMLNDPVPLSQTEKDVYTPPYGDVTALNTCRLIMDAVGKATLKKIGEYAITLLDTSVAIYEANGDYAFGMFSSGWCRVMDGASRELCGTTDNQTALTCGKWLCHENCWNDSAKKAMETGTSTDIHCVGGIHLYCEPIVANQKVVGAINIGYGDPPDHPDKLKALAHAFHVDPEMLKKTGDGYKSRPEFIIRIAKKQLAAFAKLIGEMVEKEQTRKALKAEMKRNQALLDYSPVCHKIVDLDFNLQYMSANGFKMLKLDTDAPVYGKPYPFSFFPPEFKNTMRENLQKVKHTGESTTMEAQTSDSNGNAIWLESALIPVFDDHQQIEYLTVVSADTTWRKTKEEEKKRLEKQLRQSQKMESIGNLAGGIAHDFNNILAAIIGFTEIALDEAPKGSLLDDSLQEIYAAGKRARDVVKQILAFARQSEEKKHPIQPGAIAKDVLTLIRSTLPATIDIRPTITSNSWIMGNATQIHQVLINLCTNAADAMERSGGVLRLTIQDMAVASKYPPAGIRQGNYIEIRVSDNGAGIAPDIMDAIFEPYFTTKAPGEGTGMGLAMAQGVIESHGGEISVESQLGKGTTFTIYLPITKKRPANGADTPEQLPKGMERILFVDDEVPIAKMGGRILEQQGYFVTTTTSSTEALALFQAAPADFDLVITDMTMPDMTGDRLAAKLMKIRPDIPVILCTGYSTKISDKTAIEIGIRAFAYKPVAKAELAKIVRKVLDEAGGK